MSTYCAHPVVSLSVKMPSQFHVHSSSSHKYRYVRFLIGYTFFLFFENLFCCWTEACAAQIVYWILSLRDPTSDSFRGNNLNGTICELLNTLSAVEMLHNSALHRFMIDTGIYVVAVIRLPFIFLSRWNILTGVACALTAGHVRLLR